MQNRRSGDSELGCWVGHFYLETKENERHNVLALFNNKSCSSQDLHHLYNGDTIGTSQI